MVLPWFSVFKVLFRKARTTSLQNFMTRVIPFPLILMFVKSVIQLVVITRRFMNGRQKLLRTRVTISRHCPSPVPLPRIGTRRSKIRPLFTRSSLSCRPSVLRVVVRRVLRRRGNFLWNQRGRRLKTLSRVISVISPRVFSLVRTRRPKPASAPKLFQMSVSKALLISPVKFQCFL